MVQDREWKLVAPGTRIGSFEIRERLGRGGMGEVYRARHLTLGGDYAVKVVHGSHPSTLERFLREGQHASRLNHPNVVRVHHVEVHEGAPVLVMELVDGGDLASFLDRRPGLRLEQVDLLARGIIRGVRAAHQFGLVHRDLKPNNILLQERDGEVVPKIGDFGLAKVCDGRRSGPTHAGTMLGSPSYMAPEQWFDARAVDQRADLFSLGCVLYELLTSQQAFPGKQSHDVFERIRHGAYVPTEHFRPDCPERMRRSVDGCLQPDPAYRIANCDLLELIWAGQPNPAWGDDTLRALRADLPELKRHLAARASTSRSTAPSTFDEAERPTEVAADPTRMRPTSDPPTRDPPPSGRSGPMDGWGFRTGLLTLVGWATIATLVSGALLR